MPPPALRPRLVPPGNRNPPFPLFPRISLTLRLLRRPFQRMELSLSLADILELKPYLVMHILSKTDSKANYNYNWNLSQTKKASQKLRCFLVHVGIINGLLKKSRHLTKKSSHSAGNFRVVVHIYIASAHSPF